MTSPQRAAIIVRHGTWDPFSCLSFSDSVPSDGVLASSHIYFVISHLFFVTMTYFFRQLATKVTLLFVTIEIPTIDSHSNSDGTTFYYSFLNFIVIFVELYAIVTFLHFAWTEFIVCVRTYTHARRRWFTRFVCRDEKTDVRLTFVLVHGEKWREKRVNNGEKFQRKTKKVTFKTHKRRLPIYPKQLTKASSFLNVESLRFISSHQSSTDYHKVNTQK